MNRPPFERAIVVTFDEVKTLRSFMKVMREAIQNDEERDGTLGLVLLDIAHLDRKLEEVQKHMETDETIWEEHMREYDEAER